MATKKTGLNSAYRRALNDRQDSRRNMVIGVVLGLLFLLPVLFGHEKSNPVEIVDDSAVIAEMSAEAKKVHPLTAYAQGRDIDGRYASLEAATNVSGR